MTKLKTAVVIIALAGTTTGWMIAQKNSASAELELSRLRQEAIAQAQEIERDDASHLLSSAELTRLQSQQSELMRFRAEVTELRRQLRETPAAAGPTRTPMAMREPQPEEQTDVQTLGIAKLNVAKRWSLAFFHFAQANNGRMPTDFLEAERTYAELHKEVPAIAQAPDVGSGDGFEITFQGKLDDIENPAQAIIMREKEPFHIEADGAAHRTYLFADGHSEVHRARDGNFERWEEQRRPRLKAEATAAE